MPHAHAYVIEHLTFKSCLENTSCHTQGDEMFFVNVAIQLSLWVSRWFLFMYVHQTKTKALTIMCKYDWKLAESESPLYSEDGWNRGMNEWL